MHVPFQNLICTTDSPQPHIQQLQVTSLVFTLEKLSLGEPSLQHITWQLSAHRGIKDKLHLKLFDLWAINIRKKKQCMLDINQMTCRKWKSDINNKIVDPSSYTMSIRCRVLYSICFNSPIFIQQYKLQWLRAKKENCLQPGEEEASNTDFFHKFLWALNDNSQSLTQEGN